jgi:hypothetical protein
MQRGHVVILLRVPLPPLTGHHSSVSTANPPCQGVLHAQPARHITPSLTLTPEVGRVPNGPSGPVLHCDWTGPCIAVPSAPPSMTDWNVSH